MTLHLIRKCCETCGNDFAVEPYRVDAKFCSMECLWAGRKPRKRKYASVVCSQCHKSYEVEPWRLGKTKFCSSECSGRAHMEVRKAEYAEVVRASQFGMKRCIE